jgi:hypothetical protein
VVQVLLDRDLQAATQRQANLDVAVAVQAVAEHLDQQQPGASGQFQPSLEPVHIILVEAAAVGELDTAVMAAGPPV